MTSEDHETGDVFAADADDQGARSDDAWQMMRIVCDISAAADFARRFASLIRLQTQLKMREGEGEMVEWIDTPDSPVLIVSRGVESVHVACVGALTQIGMGKKRREGECKLRVRLKKDAK